MTSTYAALPGAKKRNFGAIIDFPLYRVAWVDDDHALIAGGGGRSRTGLNNTVSQYAIDYAKQTLTLQSAVDVDEDAPMSLAVNTHEKVFATGVTQATSAGGVNENFRLYSYDTGRLVATQQTMDGGDSSRYQRAVAFSRRAPWLVATASTDDSIAVLLVPDAKPLFPTKKLPSEPYDADFNDDSTLVAFAAANSVSIVKCDFSGTLVHVLEQPELPGYKSYIRGAKFGRGPSAHLLYVLVNASQNFDPRAPRRARQDHRVFVAMWDTVSWTLKKTKLVARRPATALDISADGALLAVGSSDLNVTVLEATFLGVTERFSKVHGFPPTDLAFNPSHTRLVSVSADSTVRVLTLRKPSIAWRLFLVLVSILVLLVAVQLA